MTAAQREALAAELAELEGPRRAEMVEAIATARAFGDLSENFEYHAAKNEQGLLGAPDRDPPPPRRERCRGGAGRRRRRRRRLVVEVEDESGGRFEVEISSVGGGISTESPLGAALVGAKVGESVQVQAPKGSWTARVVSVRSG